MEGTKQEGFSGSPEMKPGVLVFLQSCGACLMGLEPGHLSLEEGI